MDKTAGAQGVKMARVSKKHYQIQQIYYYKFIVIPNLSRAYFICALTHRTQQLTVPLDWLE